MMAKKRDLWTDALDQWFETGSAPVVQRWPSRPQLIVLILASLVLVGAAAAGIVLAVINHDRAEQWKARADAVQADLDTRTKALNRQTTRLNSAAGTIRQAQRSLRRSENDVRALEVRQTELANEKAQIEDERAQLIQVTDLLVTCNQGLSEALSIIADGGDPVFDIDLTEIGNACDSANSILFG